MVIMIICRHFSVGDKPSFMLFFLFLKHLEEMDLLRNREITVRRLNFKKYEIWGYISLQGILSDLSRGFRFQKFVIFPLQKLGRI